MATTDNSGSPTSVVSASLDPTFRKYDSTQATSYSDHRGSYSTSLYEVINQYHASNNSSSKSFNTLLDVGCGPGNATRDLAQYFDHAVGCDPSPGMIGKAQTNGGHTKGGDAIQFEVLGAEELDQSKFLGPESVDVLTAGMAAHWFRMDEFWSRAARILKPGGTVALWTKSSLYCHPRITPNAAKVQSVLSNLEDNILGPYELPSNALSRRMYESLPLPWALASSSPTSSSLPFNESNYVRIEWDRDGILPDNETDFFGGSNEESLSEIASGLGTASMVTRWREANPDLVGTDQDCVELTIRDVAQAMTGASEEELTDEVSRRRILDETKIRAGGATVLLLFSKDIAS